MNSALQENGHSPVVFSERHYTPAEIGGLWNLSSDKVRGIFEREPGVMVLADDRPGRHKRRYATLRIPESVLQRVHRKRSNV